MEKIHARYFKEFALIGFFVTVIAISGIGFSQVIGTVSYHCGGRGEDYDCAQVVTPTCTGTYQYGTMFYLPCSGLLNNPSLMGNARCSYNTGCALYCTSALDCLPKYCHSQSPDDATCGAWSNNCGIQTKTCKATDGTSCTATRSYCDCNYQCLGSTQCVGGIDDKTCGNAIDGCGNYVTVGSCPTSGGSCTSSCTSIGQTQCSGSNTYQTCYQQQTNCYQWRNPQFCPNNQQCRNGVCTSQACTENWSCGGWSICSSGTQTKSCNDLNNCGTTNNKPATTQSCTCIPNWSCSSWSTCSSSGTQTRTCTDLNSCGTTSGKPTESQTCTPTCTSNWSCGVWSTCAPTSPGASTGTQTRTCSDLNNCVSPSGQPATTQSCTPLCSGVVCNLVNNVCGDGTTANCRPTCDTTTGACGSCTPDCTGHNAANSLLIQSIPNFNLITKTGFYTGNDYTWTVKATDSSTSSLSTIPYTLNSITLSNTCDASSGVYVATDNPPSGNKIVSFTIPKGTTTNIFKVYAKSAGGKCIISFSIKDPAGMTVDPSFTVSSPSVSYSFDVRAPKSITATVGVPFDLHVDIGNNGLLQDSYNVVFSAASPQFINYTQPAVVTEVVNPGASTSVTYTLFTLADPNNQLTVTVSSVGCPTCASKSVDMSLTSGTFSLPEFGLVGFLTIIALASVMYFLLVGSKSRYRK